MFEKVTAGIKLCLLLGEITRKYPHFPSVSCHSTVPSTTAAQPAPDSVCDRAMAK